MLLLFPVWILESSEDSIQSKQRSGTFKVKYRWLMFGAALLAVWIVPHHLPVQAQEKVLITHSSESISIAP